jgi:hypothetical protein
VPHKKYLFLPPHFLFKKNSGITTLRLLGTLVLLCSLSANATVPIPTTQMLPYDPGTAPENRDVAFLAWHEDLSADGYIEEEALMSGTANVYEYIDNAAQSPAVQPSAEPAGAYTTRMLIRRPKNAADFNGVIYLEILNATARYDGAPMWNLTYPSIMDDGAAWVGVTYSDTTAAFMRDTWGTANPPAPASAQPRDNSRYATLNITTRAHTWDILNQAAALLKANIDSRNPLQGFGVDTIITTGYSQSAGYVNTFANSFYPSYSELAPCTDALKLLDQCTPIVDGYIVAAGSSSSRQLDGARSHPMGDRRNCENSLNREMPCIENQTEPAPEGPSEYDLPKIIRFTTESDIKSARVRQTMADQPLLRTYEVAGTSHADFWGSITGQYIAEYQFGIPATGTINSLCELPFNPIRTGIPLSAIQHRLARWIQDDKLPPPSQYLVWEGDFDDLDEFFNPKVNWIRDDGDNDATDGDNGRGDGNVIGGVRPPRINVPLGRYYGSNFLEGPFSTAKIFCTGIIGGFDAYDTAELRSRYRSQRIFYLQTRWNVWLSYMEGFLLPVDAKTIMDETERFDGGLPGRNKSRHTNRNQNQ